MYQLPIYLLLLSFSAQPAFAQDDNTSSHLIGIVNGAKVTTPQYPFK
ncbi:hypothetical protein [Candidatus Albibeggiatoa sp. nov. NOAA]|nr:hypothetical protein [Thiotrichaceae bacterium]